MLRYSHIFRDCDLHAVAYLGCFTGEFDKAMRLLSRNNKQSILFEVKTWRLQKKKWLKSWLLFLVFINEKQALSHHSMHLRMYGKYAGKDCEQEP